MKPRRKSLNPRRAFHNPANQSECGNDACPPSEHETSRPAPAAFSIVSLALALLCLALPSRAQDADKPAAKEKTEATDSKSTNAPAERPDSDKKPSTAEKTDKDSATSAKEGEKGKDEEKSKSGDSKKDGDKSNPDEIQVSFQGANIEMIVQWLAQTTGKSVLKHPRVQCQLTIVGSKKV